MKARVGWLDGVVVMTKSGLLRFDPLKKESRGSVEIFISHAHNDHLGGLGSDVKGYFTSESRDILSEGKYKEKLGNFIPLRYGDDVSFGGVNVTVHNSGHVLGSAQYEIRDAETSIVYTGDLNCRDMLTTKAADVVSCDTLIVETTYGTPFYVFPGLTEIHVNIINWAIGEIQKGRTPTFVTYSVGKAQEIVKVFNEFTSIPIVASPYVARVNEVYGRNGVKLNYANSMSEEGKECLKQSCVQVVSLSEKSDVVGSCSFAIATGWALKPNVNYVNAAFPLSSHADFNQLVDYVKRVKPKEVFTVHGFKKDFASYLSRKLGIRAREIPPIKQSSLRAFM